jgi:hypothetical protein
MAVEIAANEILAKKKIGFIREIKAQKALNLFGLRMSER